MDSLRIFLEGVIPRDLPGTLLAISLVFFIGILLEEADWFLRRRNS